MDSTGSCARLERTNIIRQVQYHMTSSADIRPIVFVILLVVSKDPGSLICDGAGSTSSSLLVLSIFDPFSLLLSFCRWNSVFQTTWLLNRLCRKKAKRLLSPLRPPQHTFFDSTHRSLLAELMPSMYRPPHISIAQRYHAGRHTLVV